MSGVQTWRHKPPKPSNDVIYAARYEPNHPLAGVIRVARMAPEGRCAVAYLPVTEEDHSPVLVAACLDPGHGVHSYTVVPPGQYLIYDAKYGSLDCYTGNDLTAWYDLEEETP